MNKNPKISIIIPVYNREKLLPITLDSIICQSFTDWECILVDDDSTDGSYNIMQYYQQKDHRFKIFKRPYSRTKGANACRNYGFEQTSGLYVKWFDSDDIMLYNHLERSCCTLVENRLDFVISDTLNFNHENGEILDKPYDFEKRKLAISAKNLAIHRIGWITDDFLGKHEIVQNIKFNENIVDGDEYNFFIKMLHQPVKGCFLEEVLTHRRLHQESISFRNKENEINYLNVVATLKYQTAQDLVVYKDTDLIRWFLSGYMQYAFKLALNERKVPYFFSGFKLIFNYYSLFNGFAFFLALMMAKHFKKGYNVMKYARK